jgi:hypothetical protein
VFNRWGYRLAPATAGGCDVTEWFELPSAAGFRLYWLLAGHWRMRTNLTGMRATLDRIRSVVEAG